MTMSGGGSISTDSYNAVIKHRKAATSPPQERPVKYNTASTPLQGGIDPPVTSNFAAAYSMIKSNLGR